MPAGSGLATTVINELGKLNRLNVMRHFLWLKKVKY